MEILLNIWSIGAGSLKWGRLLVLYEVSIDFLQYKNGSKFFYDLLRPIPTYTEGPQIFKKIVIALTYVLHPLPRLYWFVLRQGLTEWRLLLLLQLPNKKAPLPTVSVSTYLLTTPMALHDYKDHFGGSMCMVKYNSQGRDIGVFFSTKKEI